MEDNVTQDVRKEGEWAVVAVVGRLDSFNFDSFCSRLSALIDKGHHQIALDLSQTKFLSFPSIKYLTKLAEELEQGGGAFALLAASEKLKRQIDIYATLNPIKLVRTPADLRNWKPGGPRVDKPIPGKAVKATGASGRKNKPQAEA